MQTKTFKGSEMQATAFIFNSDQGFDQQWKIFLEWLNNKPIKVNTRFKTKVNSEVLEKS